MELTEGMVYTVKQLLTRDINEDVAQVNGQPKRKCMMTSMMKTLGKEFKCDRLVQYDKKICKACNKKISRLPKVNDPNNPYYNALICLSPNCIKQVKCVETIDTDDEFIIGKELNYCKDHICKHCYKVCITPNKKQDSFYGFILCLNILKLNKSKDVLKLIFDQCDMIVDYENMLHCEYVRDRKDLIDGQDPAVLFGDRTRFSCPRGILNIKCRQLRDHYRNSRERITCNNDINIVKFKQYFDENLGDLDLTRQIKLGRCIDCYTFRRCQYKTHDGRCYDIGIQYRSTSVAICPSHLKNILQ